MKIRLRVFRCKKGLETVTAVLMLFIMLAIMTGLIAAFYNYSTSARIQLINEGQRSQEQITVTKYSMDQNLLNVTIVNTGTIEVTIRSLYKLLDGQVTYYCDPSTYTLDTHIAVGKSLSLYFPAGIGLESQERVIAATERGVKSLDYYKLPVNVKPPIPLGDTKYIYGDLELEWTEFKFTNWTGNGAFNPNGPWYDGWLIQGQNSQANIAWSVTIKNINKESRDIILTQDSGFMIDPTGTGSGSQPSKTTWFLYSGPYDQNQPQTVTLPVGQEVPVRFVWKISGGSNTNPYQGIYSQNLVCMIFLTFYGHYSNNDPYGQTIPFESAINIK
jgi:hypothetical protein